MNAMKCVCVEKVNEIVVKHVNVPQPQENQVLIKVKASGICGTDVHIKSGGYIAKYPLIIGHEFSGEVVQVGKKCTRIKEGNSAAVEPNIPCNNCEYCLNGAHHFCLNMVIPGVTVSGGMAEYVCVDEIAVFDTGDIPYTSAAFMEPLSCSLHAAERLQTAVGDTVLVMGGGPNGIIHGKVNSMRGVSQIDYLERNEFRAANIKKYHWGKVYTDIKQVPERYYDAVIEATGVTILASEAQKFVKPLGKILIFGVSHKDEYMNINAFDMFKHEISYIGSYTSKKDSLRALKCLQSKKIELDDIISHAISLDEVPEFIERLEQGGEGLKKIMIVFE